MQIRAAQHKVGAGLADLGAVKEQPDMVWLGMCSALLEAIGHGLQANPMAIQAVLDTLLHPGLHSCPAHALLATEFLVLKMGHRDPLSLCDGSSIM